MGIDAIVAIAGWILLLPTFFLLGTLFSPWLSDQPSLIRGVLYFALGLILMVCVILLLSSWNAVTVINISWVIGLTLPFRIKWIPEFWDWIKSVFSYLFSDLVCSKDIALRITQLFLAGAMLMTFVASLFPEIANDALCYQLNLAKLFTWQSAVHPIPYDLNSYLPVFMNSLYVIGMLVHSAPLAKLFHWWSGFFLTLVLIFAIEKNTVRRPLAFMLGLIFYLTPAVMNELTTTYVDVAVAFFVFLFFWLFLQGRTSEKPHAFLFSGLFLGIAVSVKLLVLLAMIPIALIFLFQVLFNRDRVRHFTLAFFFALGFLGAVSFWFIRNGFLTGNPFYPYFGSFFASQDFGYLEHFRTGGPQKEILSFFLTPFRIFVNSDFYDKGHWLGPVYLLLSPFMAVGVFSKRENWWIAVFCVGYYWLWFVVFSNGRFLIPLLPILLFTASLGWDKLCKKNPIWLNSHVLLPAYFLLMAFLFLFSGYHYRYQWLPIGNVWPQDVYLSKLERSYPVAQWINKHLSSDVKILNAEDIHQLYFDRDMVRNRWLRLTHGYDRSQYDAHPLLYLKSLGFTHVLRMDLLDRRGDLEQRSAYAKLDGELADKKNAYLLTTIESQNIREPRFIYRVYEIR